MVDVAPGHIALLLYLVLCWNMAWAAKSSSSHSSGNSNSSSGLRTSTQKGVHTQIPTQSTASFVSASTGLAPLPTDVPVVVADPKPYKLNDSMIVRSDLNMNASDGLFYTFNTTANTPIYISLSVCSGPSIPAYNTSNSTLLNHLGRNAAEARQSTLVSMYVSDKWNVPRPGPDSGISSSMTGFAQGGWTDVQLKKGSKDGVWIGVYPPADPRGIDGTYRIQLSASTKAQMENVDNRPMLFYDDSDVHSALLTSFNYTSPAPNISLIVLPTDGEYSLSSITYFNSSFCAVFDTWNKLQDSINALQINSSETSRNTIQVVTRGDEYRRKKGNKSMSSSPEPSLNDTAGLRPPGSNARRGVADPVPMSDLLARGVNVTKRDNDDGGDDADNVPGPQVRKQFLVKTLDPGRNYTAYLVSSQNSSGILSRTLYPSVKFVTKTNRNCRLLYNVPFCPELAYSIPFNPENSIEDAMKVLGEMISANYGNFSATLGTFPCDSDEFGMYSSVTTCADCLRAYQSWLCAVAIPRCTDMIDPAESAASQDGTDLEGLPMPSNTQLHPYVVNRIGKNSSRQSYIDELLSPGDYGELLPCLSTCEMVTRSCPPLLKWKCPKWTVTAERDYGTFADAGTDGLGEDLNGGAGPEGLRYGGAPSRYVAYDAFGHVYCNAMDVDRLLRQASSAARPAPAGALLVAALVAWSMTW